MATPLDPELYQAELQLARRRAQHPKSLIGRGSSHRAAVRGVQQRLSELGFEVSEDGIFGEETEKALKEFQGTRSAKVDGVVGRETLGKLQRATRAKSNPADTGLDAVERVVTAGRPQPAKSGRALGDIEAEQKGGGRSASKVEKGSHGGTVDANGKERASNKTGPIGVTTIHKPTKASWEDNRNPETGSDGGAPSNSDFESKHPREGGKFVQKGDSGEPVQNAQEALKQVGDKNLKVDGQFGPKTDKSVRHYQRSVGLTVDGIVGPKTSASLRRRLRLVQKANAKT